MTSTVAIEHLNRARAARDAGRLADCLTNATTAWGIAEAERQPHIVRDAISTIARAHYAREEADEARRWYEEAFNYAKAHRLVLGMAYAAHDRYVAALACGKREEAHRAAGTALDLYDYRGARVSALTADRSMECLSSDPGYALHAWRAFYADAAEARNGRDCTYALANIVTAVSHLDKSALFDVYWPALRAILNPEMERAAMLYVTAAEDCIRRDRRQEGFALAEKAREIATDRGERVARERAESALECANSASVPDAAP
jgi:hypothetical protein